MRNEFYGKVFRWLGIGLFVTFLVAYLVSMNVNLLSFVFSGYTYIILFVLEIVICIWLTARIHQMSKEMATILYLGYTALTGFVLSSIFIVYEIESVIWIFLVSSLIFICFSFIGMKMNIDLRKLGVYLFIMLLGV